MSLFKYIYIFGFCCYLKFILRAILLLIFFIIAPFLNLQDKEHHNFIDLNGILFQSFVLLVCRILILKKSCPIQQYSSVTTPLAVFSFDLVCLHMVFQLYPRQGLAGEQIMFLIYFQFSSRCCFVIFGLLRAKGQKHFERKVKANS